MSQLKLPYMEHYVLYKVILGTHSLRNSNTSSETGSNNFYSGRINSINLQAAQL